jgi:hypothetical protein
MLAHMSGPAANSTAHAAIAVEATMAWLSRSDARQSQQLPQCVDRPMVRVRKGCYRRLGYSGYLKLAVVHASRSALSTVHAQQSVAATTQQGSMVCTVGTTAMRPLCMRRTRGAKPSSRAKGTGNAAKDADAPSRGTDTRA